MALRSEVGEGMGLDSFELVLCSAAPLTISLVSPVSAIRGDPCSAGKPFWETCSPFEVSLLDEVGKEGRRGKGKEKKGRKKEINRMRENNITQFYYRFSLRKTYATPFHVM